MRTRNVQGGSISRARGAGQVEPIVLEDGSEVAARAARHIAASLKDAIARRGHATLALSGGSTPEETYALLARSNVDWSRVDIVWVDERAVPPSHSRSNFAMAQKALLSPAKVPPERVHRMKGEMRNLAQSSREYEAELRQVLGEEMRIDVAVMGMGDDGHTASLFPGSPLLSERTRWVVDVPSQNGLEPRLTLTPRALSAARELVVLVVGEKKAEALSRVMADEGNVAETPARLFREVGGKVTWYVDEAAMGR